MFKRRRLACSFCGKRDAEVGKLVAGPKVFICDECVAIASRLMADSAAPPPRARTRPLILRVLNRIRRWLERPGNGPLASSHAV